MRSRPDLPIVTIGSSGAVAAVLVQFPRANLPFFAVPAAVLAAVWARPRCERIAGT